MSGPGEPVLFHHFDRIRAALDRQERERRAPGTFGAWVVRALPQFAKHLDAVDAVGACRAHVAYWDWLDARRLKFREEIKWHPSMTGPLVFVGPTMDDAVKEARAMLPELGLVGRSASAPTPKEVPWSRGKKSVAGSRFRYPQSTSGAAHNATIQEEP